MKKTLLASTVIAILVANLATASSKEDSQDNFSSNTGASKEENIGFFSGAISGTLIGGPIGFIVGGISGVLMGEQVKKANQLDQAKGQLALTQDENDAINQQLGTLKAQISNSTMQAMKAADWITQGLTLNLMFTTNSTELSDNDLQMINRLSSLLNEYPDLNIRLNGYSDARGDEDSNMALSEARIRVVESIFALNGIDSTRLNLTAHGEAESLESAANPDHYAMDRRVSIQFYKKEVSSVAQY